MRQGEGGGAVWMGPGLRLGAGRRLLVGSGWGGGLLE
jgi:hypothetical protein